ncbi:MAG: hypothetical protein LAQ69_17155 [Acidobacteriia bacterium]|nr:hypothetical protein [Terriglobia bacterium]
MRATTLVAVLIVGSFTVCLPAAPPGQSRKVDIEQQLQAQYPPTRLAGDKLRITQPGSVLVVQMDGMFASPMNEFAFTNTYKDGWIKRSVASALIHDPKTSRDLQVGEKVYLLKTEVKDSGIVFSVQSCIACDGSEVDQVQMAFRASLTFQFPKGYLETTDFAQIQRAISQVFTFADSGSTEAPQSMESPVPQVPQPALPPKPAAPAEPARIELGQTTEQVTANLGQPDKIVNLGSKKIYIYRDLKITFLDGKVQDVQ